MSNSLLHKNELGTKKDKKRAHARTIKYLQTKHTKLLPFRHSTREQKVNRKSKNEYDKY